MVAPTEGREKRREQSEIRPNEAGWEPSRLQDAPTTAFRRSPSLGEGGYGVCVSEGARSRSSIFTNHRKVLLFLIREAKPSNLTQTKTYHPNPTYAVAPKGAYGTQVKSHSKTTKSMQPPP